MGAPQEIAEMEANRDATTKTATANCQPPIALVAQLKAIGPHIGARHLLSLPLQASSS
jgi:hypothetical protein